MKIGNIGLTHGLMLAPMAGYTDRAMRLVCREMGAEYTVTEMVSAKAVVYRDKKTYSLARIFSDEGPVAIQLFGSEADIMAEAAAILSEPCPKELFPSEKELCEVSNRSLSAPVAIDINMGCPVKKIFSNGEGSALMREPEKIEKIVSAVCRKTSLPVTVKIRAGVDGDHINAVECAKRAEAGGASMVCIHGRTTKQMYGGSADRSIIEKVKKSLQIPLVANGDITSSEAALSMISDTGADGIAIGRGAVGNPFIFSEIIAALENKSYSPPTIEEKIAIALRQLELAVIDKGEAYAIPEARKQIALYLRSFHNAAKIRADINLSQTFEDVKRALLSALE